MNRSPSTTPYQRLGRDDLVRLATAASSSGRRVLVLDDLAGRVAGHPRRDQRWITLRHDDPVRPEAEEWADLVLLLR